MDRLEKLTRKQVEALDLLVQFKTTKEIARILGISPASVDQRIKGAGRNLDAKSRRHAAQIYLELRSVLQTASAGTPDYRRVSEAIG